MATKSDILKNLPRGAQKYLSAKHGVSTAHINNLLSGKREVTDRTRNIIADAHLLAAVASWEIRHQVGEYNLDPFKVLEGAQGRDYHKESKLQARVTKLEEQMKEILKNTKISFEV